MAIRHSTVTVGITPTELTSDVPDTRDFSKHSVLLQNRSAVTVFLGGSDVTTADFGYALVPNGDVTMDLEEYDVLFGVVAVGTADLNVLHQGV